MPFSSYISTVGKTVNQQYFHVIVTIFSYSLSVCGLTHIKKPYITTEQTIINSGLFAFKINFN